MKKFENCKEIREHFIKSGWSDKIEFEEIEPRETGVTPITKKQQTQKYFRMKSTGNIFDENGKIYCYNI